MLHLFHTWPLKSIFRACTIRRLRRHSVQFFQWKSVNRATQRFLQEAEMHVHWSLWTSGLHSKLESSSFQSPSAKQLPSMMQVFAWNDRHIMTSWERYYLFSIHLIWRIDASAGSITPWILKIRSANFPKMSLWINRCLNSDLQHGQNWVAWPRCETPHRLKDISNLFTGTTGNK